MNVSLSGNSFYGNGASEINVVGQPGGYVINDWETGQPYTLLNENLTLTQNIAAAQNATEQAFINGYLGGTEWSQFVSTLSSNQNTWWSPNSNAFTVPTPKAWTTLDFAQWQSLTGQDALSTWASSSLPPACNVSPLGPDYWLLMQTITSSPVVVNPAGVATWNLAAMPLGGMTGTINLTMDGVSAIPGATANLNPATISTSGTSVLTLLTSPTTPAGTYPITIVGSHGNLTRTITVSVTIPKTSVRLSAADVAFPQEPVGGTSTPQQVTLTNTGTTALAISSIAASWQFSETNTCGSTVKAGASCTISIAFAPTQVGLQAGTVTITDSDPTSPQVVSLTGTAVAAPDVSYSVASLDFGWHKLGTSQTRSITVTNSGGATLTITNMTISGTNAADFSQTNNCGSSLAAGATCTINVTFTPSAAGTRSASLSVYDNDVDSSSPQVLGLTGTGG